MKKPMIQAIAKTIPFFLGLLVSPAGFPQNTGSNIGDVIELDRIIAVVNDDILMASELNIQMQEISQGLETRNIPLPPIDILQKQVLKRLILQRLQLQEAKRSGIHIEDQVLNRAVQNVAQANNLTLEQLRRLLKRNGSSFTQFRENMRENLMISHVRNRKVKNRITVSNQEIEHQIENLKNRGDLSDQYRLGHILIAIPDGSNTSEIQKYRARAEGIMEQLKTGTDFQKAAAAHSDAQTALEGGDLGWRQHSELPSMFEDIVPSMEVGQISDIIRTSGGFHIIKLMETRSDNLVMVTQSLVRHILIKPTAIVSEHDARAKTEHLYNRIASGEDFSRLAKSNSDDTATAVNGGSLGWLIPGQTVQEFEDVIEKTKTGEVSPAFKSPFGWHILKVEDRRKHDSTVEFRRNKAREAITKRKTEEELELWLRRLYDEAYIDIRLDDDA